MGLSRYHRSSGQVNRCPWAAIVLLARRRRRNFRRSLVVAWCNCPPRGVAPASLAECQICHSVCPRIPPDKDTPYKEGLTRRAKRKAPTRHRGLPTTRYESVERAQPRIDVRSHLILGKAMALLDFPLQLFALSVDLSEIVVGELALLFFDLFPQSASNFLRYDSSLWLIPPRQEMVASGNVVLDSEVPRSVFE